MKTFILLLLVSAGASAQVPWIPPPPPPPPPCNAMNNYCHPIVLPEGPCGLTPCPAPPPRIDPRCGLPVCPAQPAEPVPVPAQPSN